MKDNDFINIKIKKLVEWNEPNGEGCFVSDRITKEGYKVGSVQEQGSNRNS